MTNSTAVRFAEIFDAEAIAALVDAAFRPGRFFIDGDRTDLEEVGALLQKGKFILFFEDDVLAACVYAEIRGARGYFGLLAVDPMRQRSGLGSQLVGAAEDYCRAAGCRYMDLTFVNLRQQLPGYCRSFGYIESGVLPFPPHLIPNEPVHLVQMSKGL